MPRFEPFPAVRPSPGLPLDEIVAPPYDVLSDADLDALLARHPANITHVDVPREADGPERYDAAASIWRRWLGDATMVADNGATFTLYRMRFVDEVGRERHTVGVLGALEVVDEGAGGVLPHERTTPKATTDRLDLTRATRANLSPVWGLSLTEGLTELLLPAATVVGVTTDEAGVVHTVERVDDPSRLHAIGSAIADAPVLIADGHHRYSVARSYRDEVRAATGRSDTPAELTLAYVGELVADQLSVEAIHRLYTGLDAAGLAAALTPWFDQEPAGPVDRATLIQMTDRGAACLVDQRGQGTFLRPRPEAFAGVRDLDSARLEAALADVDHEVTYQHGVAQVLGALASGQADAAILIRPVGVDEIRRTANERLLMPPKSTFFTPKLRTGLVMRCL